jgi:hypothetical protein
MVEIKLAPAAYRIGMPKKSTYGDEESGAAEAGQRAYKTRRNADGRQQGENSRPSTVRLRAGKNVL